MCNCQPGKVCGPHDWKKWPREKQLAHNAARRARYVPKGRKGGEQAQNAGEAAPLTTLDSLRARAKEGETITPLVFGQAALTGLDLDADRATTLGFPEVGTVRCWTKDTVHEHMEPDADEDASWGREFIKAQEELADLSPAQVDAVGVYTTSFYRKINNHLNGIHFDTETPLSHEEWLSEELPSYRQTADLKTNGDVLAALDESLSVKRPREEPPSIVYRGVKFEEIAYKSPEEVAQWAKEKFQLGDTLNFPAYSSTSRNPILAHDFGYHPGKLAVMFEIAAWSGRYVDPVSKNQGEFEHILPRDMNFEIAGLEFGEVAESVYNDNATNCLLIKLIEKEA